MEGIQMRGYCLLSAIAYLRQAAGDRTANQLLDAVPPQVKHSIDSATQASWCPAAHVAEVYRAIAGRSRGDEPRARHELIECGKQTARDASNTFLRLMMKLLTPTLFAKKLPDVWARDCTGGKIVVQLHDDKIHNRLLEMEGFDHITPIAAGFVAFGLEAMGKSITGVTLQGWSLAVPGPRESSFEIAWKA